MFKIVQRSLIESEAKLIVDKIKLSPEITGYSLEEWLKFNADNLLVAENSLQEICGLCLYYPFTTEWVYLAVLYVFEKDRGKGLGKQLFYQACSNILNSHKNIYISTRTPAVVKMLYELDFTIFDTLFTLPEPYKKHELAFLLRDAKWILSFYRISEIIRKAVLFPNQPKFLYGIKTYNS